MKNALSPLDGRYASTLGGLALLLGERPIQVARLRVEFVYLVRLLKFLQEQGRLPESVDPLIITALEELPSHLTGYDSPYKDGWDAIAQFERDCRHDIKALELWLAQTLDERELREAIPFLHFGLTSQDVVSLAYAHQLKQYQEGHFPRFADEVRFALHDLHQEPGARIALVARTHGQPAVPTSFQHELDVHLARLRQTAQRANQVVLKAKFGGAVGTLQAHQFAFPGLEWDEFMSRFVALFGVERSQMTTQTDYYDSFCDYFDALRGYAGVLLDLCRDLWLYQSRNLLRSRPAPGQVGSSTMPQKVNPIGAENAEGNLEIAIHWFSFLSEKLRTSRLQRDLTDSTVMRNLGVPLAHLHLAQTSLAAHLRSLSIHTEAVALEADQNYQCLAEAVQTKLRVLGYADAYERLREGFQGRPALDRLDYHAGLQHLLPADLPEALRAELLELTPGSLLNLTRVAPFS